MSNMSRESVIAHCRAFTPEEQVIAAACLPDDVLMLELTRRLKAASNIQADLTALVTRLTVGE